MPLSIVATVGSASANSYSTSAAADEYLSYRVGAGAWASYTADLKAQALVTATRELDTLDNDTALFPGFIGERATDTQALAWPRSGTDYDDELPDVLVRATIELAFSYAQAATANTDPLAPASNGNLKRKKIGPIEKEWFAPTTAAVTDVAKFPAIVQALLAPLLRTVSAGVYGAGVAYRGS